jgi:hypothetical protein
VVVGAEPWRGVVVKATVRGGHRSGRPGGARPEQCCGTKWSRGAVADGDRERERGEDQVHCRSREREREKNQSR